MAGGVGFVGVGGGVLVLSAGGEACSAGQLGVWVGEGTVGGVVDELLVEAAGAAAN